MVVSDLLPRSFLSGLVDLIFGGLVGLGLKSFVGFVFFDFSDSFDFGGLVGLVFSDLSDFEDDSADSDGGLPVVGVVVLVSSLLVELDFFEVVGFFVVVVVVVSSLLVLSNGSSSTLVDELTIVSSLVDELTIVSCDVKLLDIFFQSFEESFDQSLELYHLLNLLLSHPCFLFFNHQLKRFHLC